MLDMKQNLGFIYVSEWQALNRRIIVKSRKPRAQATASEVTSVPGSEISPTIISMSSDVDAKSGDLPSGASMGTGTGNRIQFDPGGCF